MKKAYFDDSDIQETTKHYTRSLVFFSLSLALLILFPTLVFLFQTRESKFYFILFGSILTVISLFFVFFSAFVYVKPYHQYLRFYKESKQKEKQRLVAVLDEISSNVAYRHGCYFRSLSFLASGKRVFFYVKEESTDDFEIGKTYRLLVSQRIVFEMEETEE